MKNKMVKALALVIAVTTVSMTGPASIYASETDTAETAETAAQADSAGTGTKDAGADSDQEAADNVAALIDKIYVQERTDTTDADCAAAKEA